MPLTMDIGLVLSARLHCRLQNRVISLVVTAAVAVAVMVRLQETLPAAERVPGVAAEYDLKLARLYATSKFIAWPDDSKTQTAPFVIGVLDPDPFNGGLQKLTTRKLKDRPIKVVVIKSDQDYQPCHLLFIPSDAKPEVIDALLKLTANQPVLIWRDEADPLNASGVACSFVRQGDSLLIEADPVELKRRKLEPDGRLLSLNLVRVVKQSK